MSLNTYVSYRKRGKTVNVSVMFNSSVISAGTWGNFGTLPEGFRPSRGMDIVVITSLNGAIFAQMEIGTTGNILLMGNADCNGFASYLVD